MHECSVSADVPLASLGDVTPDSHSWSDLLGDLLAGRSLDRGSARDFLDAVLDGQVEPVVIAGVLVALRAKGEDPEELAGFAEAMVDHMVPVTTPGPVLDTCGTGGDRAFTINVSTGAALLAAACGALVLKHGGRASSSRAGSADVLEALGVPTQLGADELRRELERTGFGFAFAPRFHPAMAQVAPVRRALGVPTAFNVLGPLVNPGRARAQLVGVWSPSLLEPVAHVLAAIGVRHALVVHSDDGLDEVSVSAPTRFVELRSDGKGAVELEAGVLDPASLGCATWAAGAVRGGSAQENARVLEGVLEGRVRGPVRDIIVLNAAVALWVDGRSATIVDGFELAVDAISSGRAGETLARIRGGAD